MQTNGAMPTAETGVILDKVWVPSEFGQNGALNDGLIAAGPEVLEKGGNTLSKPESIQSMESGGQTLSTVPEGQAHNLFCCAHYDAPEGRPWVYVHTTVGICAIHFGITVAQSLIFLGVAIANPEGNIPQLFNIKAGNIQLVVNIIVSCINFILLPMIGSVSDYTRYRYHIGCFALCGLAATEFVTFGTSKQYWQLLIATAVVCGLFFQTVYMNLRISYITEMSTTREGTVRISTHGFAMLFFSQFIWMIFVIIVTAILYNPIATFQQQFDNAILLTKISSIAAGTLSIPFIIYSLRGLKVRPAVLVAPEGRTIASEVVSTYVRKVVEIYHQYNQLGALIISYASTHAVQIALGSIINTYLLTELKFIQLYAVLVLMIAISIGMIGVLLSQYLIRYLSLRTMYIITITVFASTLIIAPFCLQPYPCLIQAGANLTNQIRTAGANPVNAKLQTVCPLAVYGSNGTCVGRCPPSMLLTVVMTRISTTPVGPGTIGGPLGVFEYRSGDLGGPVAIACAFGAVWGVLTGWVININQSMFARFCPGGRETEYSGLLAAALRSCDWVPTVVWAVMYQALGEMKYNFFALAALFVVPFLIAVFYLNEDKAREEIASSLDLRRMSAMGPEGWKDLPRRAAAAASANASSASGTGWDAAAAGGGGTPRPPQPAADAPSKQDIPMAVAVSSVPTAVAITNGFKADGAAAADGANGANGNGANGNGANGNGANGNGANGHSNGNGYHA